MLTLVNLNDVPITLPIFLLLGLCVSLLLGLCIWYARVSYKHKQQQQESERKINEQNEKLKRRANELDQIVTTLDAQTILLKRVGKLIKNRDTIREDFYELLPICRWQDEIFESILTMEEVKRFPNLKNHCKLEPLVEYIVKERYLD